MDCEKEAVVPEAGKAGLPKTVEETYVFDAPPLRLAPYLAVRLVLSVLFVLVLAAALAASGVVPVRRMTESAGLGLGGNLFVLWGAVAVLAVLIAVANTFIRAFRVRHTLMFGQPLQYRRSPAAIVWGVASNLLILAATAGLALPWIHARNRRKFYATVTVPARGNRPLEFLGSGEEVLGRALLTLVCLPLAPVATWIWVKWEHSNLLFWDRFSRQRPMVFQGSFPGYLGRALLGWLLSIGTLGILRPRVLVAEWRWIAANTVVDDERRLARTSP